VTILVDVGLVVVVAVQVEDQVVVLELLLLVQLVDDEVLLPIEEVDSVLVITSSLILLL